MNKWMAERYTEYFEGSEEDAKIEGILKDFFYYDEVSERNMRYLIERLYCWREAWFEDYMDLHG